MDLVLRKEALRELSSLSQILQRHDLAIYKAMEHIRNGTAIQVLEAMKV